MQQPANSKLLVDLSGKSQDEITEVLQALLAARRTLLKKGFSLKISRRRSKSPKFPVSK